MQCENMKKYWCYTDLQQRFAHISDSIEAEGWNHVWFVVNGENYYVYENGDILRQPDLEREKI